MADLRAVLVIDYQNVHLTGHELFAVSRDLDRHESLIDPLMFANRLIRTRNRLQRDGMAHACLTGVLVFRGQPSSLYDEASYARSQAQKSQWERDPRVAVTLRPLKYDFERDADGRPTVGSDGRRIPKGKREKGIDVLCALAVVAQARKPDVDLVILASGDTDLEPALDEAIDLRTAKIETFSWFDADQPRLGRQLRPADGRRVWNTRLNESDFRACWDPTKYS